MATKNAAELDRLGLTEDRELARRIDNRAMVLAQLNGDVSERLDIGCIASAAQCCSDVSRCDRAAYAAHRIRKLTRTICGKGLNCGGSVLGRHEAQGCQREIVVRLITGRPTSRRQHEHAAWTAAAAFGRRAVGRTVVGNDQTHVDERGQLPPNTGGRHLERLRQVGCRRGAYLHEGARDPLSGLAGEYHNDIVA